MSFVDRHLVMFESSTARQDIPRAGFQANDRPCVMVKFRVPQEQRAFYMTMYRVKRHGVYMPSSCRLAAPGECSALKACSKQAIGFPLSLARSPTDDPEPDLLGSIDDSGEI